MRRDSSKWGLVAVLSIASALLLLAAPSVAQSTYLTFESGHVRPVALSPDGNQLLVVNTPDNTLEVFDIDVNGDLSAAGSVQVGMEPVAVAARSNSEAWVVNFLSDSVSVVDLSGAAPRVVRTLHVGDEPSDIVFAGSGGNRAFITTAHRGQNTPTPDGDYDAEGIGRADIWVFDATSLGGSLGGDEETIITVFGDKPRALAVSNDGSKVYAAIFRSGNQTMALNAGHLCETSQSNLDNDVLEGSCSIGGATSAGGSPPPHNNTESTNRPATGLIVKLDRDGGASSTWQDELKVCDSGPDQDEVCTTNGDCGGSGQCEPRDWSPMVKFNLPDRDVFEINANANPPVAVDGSSSCSDGSGCWAHVGTTIFNMAVHPTSGKIYVSNTDAQNHVRFEGPGTLASSIKPAGEPATVQGNLAHSRITVLDGSSVDPRHLNKHINYAALPAPAGIKEKSLATPLGMVFDATGQNLYVAAFGSSKVGIFDTTELENDTFTPDAGDHIQLSGGGPSGLVRKGTRLYVATRFNNSISVVDTVTKTEVQTVVLHNPEPQSVVDGRLLLYDANLSSSNGEASCSSCHIFGDMDDLGWDLGNPDDDVKANPNAFNNQPFIDEFGANSCVIQSFAFPGTSCAFHPMKGPMTTQSLRGLSGQGPEHWRGDRSNPGPNGDTAETSFFNFIAAFPGLLGMDGTPSIQEMVDFTLYAMQLRYPPNPIRNLDNSLTTLQQAGKDVFELPDTDTVESCDGCHSLEPSQGFFGGSDLSTFDAETQVFKVPHLRNAYQKIGMFGVAEPEAVTIPIIGSATPFEGPFTATGDQIRGFGFTHDGSVDTLFRFVSAAVFDIDDTEQEEVEAFIVAFDSDLAPIVGQQVTLTSSNSGVANPRIDLMIARANTNFPSKVLVDLNGGAVTECDVIAKLREGGDERGYLYESGSWTSDDLSAAISTTALKDKANEGVCVGGTNSGAFCSSSPTCTGGGTCEKTQEVTFTCVPPGSGYRMALDRDDDTLLDGVETGTGFYVHPDDTGTRADNPDTDGDGFDDGDEVAQGTDPTNPFDFPGAVALPLLSTWGIGLLVVALALGALLARPRRRLPIG